MSYDLELANWVRSRLLDEEDIGEREMFGGLAFLIRGNFFVGVSGAGGLLVRLSLPEAERALEHPFAGPMVLQGRRRPGWVRVAAEGLGSEADREEWVASALEHARALAPKRTGATGSRPLRRRIRTSGGGARAGEIRDFDAAALWLALDARRREQGLSWSGVARAIWEQSFVLNARRKDHPISSSTIAGLRARGESSCQHAVFMLRWLGECPESFLVGGGVVPTSESLPACGPHRRLRWDLRATYEALNDARRGSGLTWSELALELSCTPSQLTGIRTARFAIGMGLAMRIAQWLGRPAADFVYCGEW